MARKRVAVGSWWRRRDVWFAGLCAVAGVAAILAVRAADFSAAAEAEGGNLTGRAVQRTDAAASGGSAVVFAPPRQYVAVGDSVASGDGIEYGWVWQPDGAGDGSWVRTGPANPIWEPASDTTPAVQACHRSKKAYPYLVAAATGDNLYNPSCSGSSIIDGIMVARNFGSGVVGAAQVGSATRQGAAPPNPAYDAFKPDIVSITTGMNDINFSDILRKCFIGTTCVTTENDQLVDQRLAVYRNNLQVLLTEIKDRGTAAGKLPWIVLTTYPDPFPTDGTAECSDTYIGLGNGVGANEISWLRTKMQAMNQHIEEIAATYPKSKVVDLTHAVAGHEFCTADPWVYGLSIWYNDFGNQAPFHPTPKGHEAIAGLLVPVINELD